MDKRGDDLTGFRHDVVQVMKTHKPVNGIEVGKAGLAVRSVVLIMDNGEYLGSLEFIQGLASVAKSMSATAGVDYALVVEDRFTELAKELEKNPRVGSYVLASDKWFNVDSFARWNARLLDQVKQQGYAIDNGYFYTLAQAHDFAGNVIGLHLLSEPLSGFHAIYQQSADEIASTRWSVFVGMLLLLFLMQTLIQFQVVAPMRRTEEVMNRSAQNSDLSLRVPVLADDELGTMAKAYNDQMSRFSLMLGQVQSVLSALAAGDLDKRITAPMENDFARFRDGVNQTADAVSNVFRQLDDVFRALAEGNLHASLSDVGLQGRYAGMIQDARGSMLEMSQVFDAITLVLNELADGEFTRRVDGDPKGDLLTLKNNVNRSLDNIERIIQDTSNVLLAMGSGDMTKRLEGGFRGNFLVLKEAINNSMDNLSGLMAQTLYGTRAVAQDAGEIASGMNELAERSHASADALQKTAAAVEQINASVRQNADNARSMQLRMQSSNQIAERANSVVLRSIHSMQSISAASEKIASIVGLIDSIAFQTNLLALNAAVEAARAGEHGRGFAVVAGEVRALASKSADAAHEIRALIDDSIARVQEGTAHANDSGKAIDEINTAIGEIGGMVSEMVNEAEQQAIAINEITDAMERIEHMNQENVALVDSTLDNTRRVESQSSKLSAAVNTFKVDVAAIKAELAMRSGDFTFVNARRAHKAWKGIIRAFVAGLDVPLNMEAATDHHKCALGKWYYGPEGHALMHLPVMKALDADHAALHGVIRQIFEAQKSQDRERMEAGFAELDRLSAVVIEKLLQLEKEASVGSAVSGRAQLALPAAHKH